MIALYNSALGFRMLTLSDMSTCGWLLFQYDSTIKFSPGIQDVDVERHVYMWRIAVSV
jgi:hypothetical protein